jgi:hypothetical protein
MHDVLKDQPAVRSQVQHSWRSESRSAWASKQNEPNEPEPKQEVRLHDAGAHRSVSVDWSWVLTSSVPGGRSCRNQGCCMMPCSNTHLCT